MDGLRWHEMGGSSRIYLLRRFGSASNEVWLQPRDDSRRSRLDNWWEIRLWSGGLGRWSDPVPHDGSLDDAKAVGIAMYRMRTEED